MSEINLKELHKFFKNKLDMLRDPNESDNDELILDSGRPNVKSLRKYACSLVNFSINPHTNINQGIRDLQQRIRSKSACSRLQKGFR